MTVLIMIHYTPVRVHRIPYTSRVPDALFEAQWMGAYFQGEKIGYAYRKITDSDDGYEISERLKVRLKMMGVDKDVETALDAYTDRLFKLVSFSFRLSSDVDMHVTGKIVGKMLFITVKTGDVTSTKKIHLKEHPYMNLSIVPYVLRKGLQSGDQMTIPIISPLDMSQEYINVKVLGEDSLMSMGKMRHVYKLKASFKGIETMTWLTSSGAVLREDSPLGFSLVKEAKESALHMENVTIDVIAQVSIPFNLPLSPEKTEYLKVRLSGVDLEKLDVDGGRQRLRGDILEIHKEPFESVFEHDAPSAIGMNREEEGVQGGVSEEYLEETMFVQSKDPAIVELSREIIGGQKDLREMTRRIHEWVYRNIEKVPMITLPVAAKVLSMKKGDCNEHTVLFTALTRAAGIPTRIAVGLTYQDGFFYYHAWPEVFLDAWVAVDPTLGQFPADAAHIRILTGDMDKHVQLLSIIGKLKIEGLEYH